VFGFRHVDRAKTQTRELRHGSTRCEYPRTWAANRVGGSTTAKVLCFQSSWREMELGKGREGKSFAQFGYLPACVRVHLPIGREGAARERQNLAGSIALRRGLSSAFRCDQFTSNSLGLFRVTALG